MHVFALQSKLFAILKKNIYFLFSLERMEISSAIKKKHGAIYNQKMGIFLPVIMKTFDAKFHTVKCIYQNDISYSTAMEKNILSLNRKI